MSINNNSIDIIISGINKIFIEGKNYGKVNYGNGKKVSIEYGGNGIDTAIYGDSLSRIMSFIGYDVTREYFVKKNSDIENFKRDLDRLRIDFNLFISEESLYDNGVVDNVVSLLQKSGKCYIKDGNLWLMTTSLFDDEDRLLVNSDGTYTPFLTDLAYRAYRLSNGYDFIIDIVYDDNMKYFDGIKSGIQFMNYDDSKLEIIRINGNKNINKNIIDDINKLRYSYIAENDVYFNKVESTFMKISSLLRRKECNLQEKYSTIDNDDAYIILNKLIEFSDIVICAYKNRKISVLCNYLCEIVNLYNNYEDNTDNNVYTNERIVFLSVIRTVINNSANLLGLILREEI